MTSSTKTGSRLHNILHYRQRSTETRPQVTCTVKFVKFKYVFYELSERTDIDTDISVGRYQHFCAINTVKISQYSVVPC